VGELIPELLYLEIALLAPHTATKSAARKIGT
jgi:hypothetical protein